MRLDGDAWASRFATFEREAFRLELLPQYLVPQEADTFAAWRAGGTRPPDEGPWEATIRAATARGAVMRRVHAVTAPLSEYLKFEMTWFYPWSVTAGEDIRILDLAANPDVPLPGFDFWLFDETDVVAMLYQRDGTQIGRWLLEDADPAQFIRYRDLAIAAAVPLADHTPDAPA